jgi:ATP-dependent DNA helicase DinG
MRTFADAEVCLAEKLPGYESRTQQQALALAIEGAIASETHLLAEAGCGCGKSFGYLIPAILSGQRVVVSTATTALQDQIALKDLPFLAEHLGVPFSYAILKGRGRYLCLNKANAATRDEVPLLARILEEAAEGTFDGERVSFTFEMSNAEWARVAADTDDCQVFDCKQQAKQAMEAGDENGILCFAEKARRRARAAQIVVVNHSLYLTDLRVKELTDGFATMIGEHDVVVFDEAHEIEEYAGNVLGNEFKESGIRGLCTEVNNFAHRVVPNHEDKLTRATAEVLIALDRLWRVLEPGRIRTATLLEHEAEWVNLTNALGALPTMLMSADMLDQVPSKDLDAARKRRQRLYRRADNASRRFRDIVTADFDDLVRWVEEETWKGQKRLTLKSAPVTVAPYLRANLFDPPPTRPCGRCGGSGSRTDGEACGTCRGAGQVETDPVTAILTSATLAVNGSMSYIAGRLGIDHYDSLDVGSPFDFFNQSLLYVPKHLPEPTPANRAAWSSMMVAEIADLVRASEGRALLLFTSNREMRNAHDALKDRLPYTCLVQGSAPNKVLAEQFLADTHSILFATRSFMTGFDAQGDTCSLVVIDKLPFPVPTEPLVEARCDAIKRAGGSDFKEFTIPVMSLVLKQAFGRLIRHRNDQGVVAILDPRLKTKGYGKTIMGSLPPAREVLTIGEVTDFFEAVPA